MLRIIKTQSVQTDDGVYYFSNFDQVVSMQVDGSRHAARDSELPEDERISLFFQKVQSQFFVQPGEPFRTFYRHVQRGYQLLTQVHYNAARLFEYLESFYAAMYVEPNVCAAETRYDAFLNVTEAVPDVFRDLGPASEGYLLNYARMLQLQRCCQSARLFQAAVVSLFQAVRYLEPSKNTLFQLCRFLLTLRNIGAEHLFVLTEVPAHLIRRGCSFQELIDAPAVQFGPLGSESPGDAVLDGGEEAEEAEEAEETESSPYLRTSYKARQQHDEGLYGARLCLCGAAIALQALRRPNGELHSRWRSVLEGFAVSFSAAWPGVNFVGRLCVYACESELSEGCLLQFLEQCALCFPGAFQEVLPVLVRQYSCGLSVEAVKRLKTLAGSLFTWKEALYSAVYEALGNPGIDFTVLLREVFKNTTPFDLQDALDAVSFACGHRSAVDRTGLFQAELVSLYRHFFGDALAGTDRFAAKQLSAMAEFEQKVELTEEQREAFSEMLAHIDTGEDFAWFFPLAQHGGLHFTHAEKEAGTSPQQAMLRSLCSGPGETSVESLLALVSQPALFVVCAGKIQELSHEEAMALLPLLAHEDSRVRYAASGVLCLAPEQKCVQLAAQLFQAYDPSELRGIAFQLGEELKRNRTNDNIRAAVAAAFGLLGSRFEGVLEVQQNLFNQLERLITDENRDAVFEGLKVQGIVFSRSQAGPELSDFAGIACHPYKYQPMEEDRHQGERLQLKVRSGVARHRAALMFLRPERIDKELKEDQQLLAARALRNALASDMSTHGFASTDVLAVNKLLGAGQQTSVARTWKLVWHEGYRAICRRAGLLNPEELMRALQYQNIGDMRHILAYICIGRAQFSAQQKEEVIQKLRPLLTLKKFESATLHIVETLQALSESPFTIITAQLINPNFAREQMVNISFERDYHDAFPFTFPPMQPGFETHVAIQYALSFKEKISRGDDSIQSRFGSAFVVSALQTDAFVRDITPALVHTALLAAQQSARSEVLNFVDTRLNAMEQRQFYNLLLWATFFNFTGEFASQTDYLRLAQQQDLYMQAVKTLEPHVIVAKLEAIQSLFKAAKNFESLALFGGSMTRFIKAIITGSAEKQLIDKAAKAVYTIILVALSQSDLTQELEERQGAVEITRQTAQKKVTLIFKNISTEIFTQIVPDVATLLECVRLALEAFQLHSLSAIISAHWKFFCELSDGLTLVFLAARHFVQLAFSKAMPLEYLTAFSSLLSSGTLANYSHRSTDPATNESLLQSGLEVIRADAKPHVSAWLEDQKGFSAPAKAELTAVRVSLVSGLEIEGADVCRCFVRALRSEENKLQVALRAYLIKHADASLKGFLGLRYPLQEMHDIFLGCAQRFGGVYTVLAQLSSQAVDEIQAAMAQIEGDRGEAMTDQCVVAAILQLFQKGPRVCQSRAKQLLAGYFAMEAARLRGDGAVPEELTQAAEQVFVIMEHALHGGDLCTAELCVELVSVICGLGEAAAPSTAQELVQQAKPYECFRLLLAHVGVASAFIHDRAQFYQECERFFFHTTPGRLLLVGAVPAQPLFRYLVAPLVAYNERGRKLGAGAQAVGFVRRAASVASLEIYLTLLDEFLAGQPIMDLVTVVFDAYRFGSKCQEKKMQQGDEEALLEAAHGRFEPGEARKQLQKRLRKFYPLLLDGGSKKTYANLFQVIQAGQGELKSGPLQVLARLLRQAGIGFELKVLTQELIKQLTHKLPSHRLKARVMLGAVQLQLGTDDLEELLKNMAVQCEQSPPCVMAAAVEYVVRRLVWIDRGSALHLSTGTEDQEAHGFIFKVENDGFKAASLAFNKDNAYDALVLPDALKPAVLKQIVLAAREDLCDRTDQNSQEKIAKLFPEYGALHSHELLELLCSTVNPQKVVRDVLEPIVANAVNFNCDLMALGVRVAAGLLKNPLLTNCVLLDLAKYLLDDSRCFYCKIRPSATPSVVSRRDELLGQKSLTRDQRATVERFGHQLLEAAPEKTLSVTTQAQKNKAYVVDFCPFVAVQLVQSAIQTPLGEPLYGSSPAVLKAVRGQLSRRGSRGEPLIGQQTEASTISFQEAFPFLDVGVYSNSASVLTPAFRAINYITKIEVEQRSRLSVTKQLIAQALRQANRAADQDVLKELYEFFNIILKAGVLNPEEKQGVFQAAVLAVKSRENRLIGPFEFIKETVLQGFVHVIVYDAMEYYTTQVINSLLAAGDAGFLQSASDLIAETLSHFMLNYKMTQQAQRDKISALLKLSVEADRPAVKILSLRSLALILRGISPQYIEVELDRLSLSIFAAHAAASGVSRAEVRAAVLGTLEGLQTNQFCRGMNLLTSTLGRFVSSTGGDVQLSRAASLVSGCMGLPAGSALLQKAEEFVTRYGEQLLQSAERTAKEDRSEGDRLLAALLELFSACMARRDSLEGVCEALKRLLERQQSVLISHRVLQIALMSIGLCVKTQTALEQGAADKAAERLFCDEALGMMDVDELRARREELAAVLSRCAAASLPGAQKQLSLKAKGKPGTAEEVGELWGVVMRTTRADEEAFLPRLQTAVKFAFWIEKDLAYVCQALLNKARKICADEAVFEAVCAQFRRRK